MFDFCSVESAQTPEEFHRRETGGWEASSLGNVAWYGEAPHPTVTVGRLQPFGLPLRPLCACFPLKEIGLIKYIEYGMMWHNVVLSKMELFECYLKTV